MVRSNGPMDRVLILLVCAALTGGCSKGAPATTAQSAPGAASLDPRFALQSIVARPPPPEGTYLVDAIVVRVQTCDCRPEAPEGTRTRCDCFRDSVDVTNDAADSASWSLRVAGMAYFDYPFKVGGRYRLTVRIERGQPVVVDATAR